MITKTNLHYAGRPVVKDSFNNLFYVVSKHRTYKAAREKDKKLDNPANINKMGEMYFVIYRLPTDKEREAQRKLGIRR